MNEQNPTATTIPSLKEVIADAKKRGVAVGHFNISNLEGLWGIFNAAKALNLPVIIGTSEGEREAIGPRQAVALVKSIREQFNYPIYINADHTYSFEKVKEAIDAGYDAVICDGAGLNFDENVALVKKCVDYKNSVRPEVIIEAELGYIGTSSKIIDKLPDGVSLDPNFLTHPEDAVKLLALTGADMLAPAVGNVHGLLKIGGNPPLNINRAREIAEATNAPLVLHGGSGISNEDFIAVIKAGMSIVHINTDIRIAYMKGLRSFLTANPDETTPYKATVEARKALEASVTERLKLFNMLS